jgi:hypothetical protein
MMSKSQIGFNLLRRGFHRSAYHFLPHTLYAQVALGELPDLVIIKSATATPLGLLRLNRLLECSGIDGPWIAGGGLLYENPILGALLRRGAHVPGLFDRVQNGLPLRIARNAVAFLPNELFRYNLTVH